MCDCVMASFSCIIINLVLMDAILTVDIQHDTPSWQTPSYTAFNTATHLELAQSNAPMRFI